MFATLRQNLFLAALSGILAFAGAAAGSVLTYNLQREIWEQRARVDQRRQLLDKRVELIEQTVELMKRGDAVAGMERSYRKGILNAIAKLSLEPSAIIDLLTKTFREQIASRCQDIESQTRYETVLSLDAIFFGERTAAAVAAIQATSPWWSADSTLRARLLEAIAEEFTADYGTD